MEISVIGKDSLRKRGFVDTHGNFQVYVTQPGTYKLEVFNTKFYFEPVVVYILSDEEVENYPNKKQI